MARVVRKEAESNLGRPTSYKPEYAVRAAACCKLGATDVELANILGVSPGTISDWKTLHPDFLHAIKVDKAVADDRVVHSLYQRAVGTDTTAAIFWLKNRRPDEWRERIDINGMQAITLNIAIAAGQAAPTLTMGTGITIEQAPMLALPKRDEPTKG